MIMTKVIYITAQALRRVGFSFHEDQDARVQKMKATVKQLGGLQFNIELFSDESWTAESTNMEGIVTGGMDQSKIGSMIKDAVFTYFEIPPYLCNDTLLRGSDA